MSTEHIDPSPDTLHGALGVQGEGEPNQQPAKEPEAPAKQEDELDEEGKPRRMGGFQKRIHKLNARLAEKDEEIARLRSASQPPPAKEPEAPKASARPEYPDENSFVSYAEFKAAERKYYEDLTDWRAEEKIRSLKEQEQQQAAKAKEEEKAAETRKTWATRLEAAHDAHPDLDELLEEDLPATPAMMQTIVESEHGGELLYRLAKDPAECRRIAQLTPMAAAKALLRIEIDIEASKSQTPEPQTKVTTAAPAPLQPLKGGGSAIKDPSKLSDAEWIRAQRKR